MWFEDFYPHLPPLTGRNTNFMSENNKKQHTIVYEESHSCKVIAEIGCNHKGDFNVAKEMVNTAKNFCKVDAVKFQKRNPKECLDEVTYNSSHPDPYHTYGATYGQHREYLEFDIQQHRELKKLCDELELIYSCSVWDITSAKEISSLKPQWIKIPSACNGDKKLLEALIDCHDGEIHVSCGMTTRKAQEGIVKFFEEMGRNQDLVLYACTSAYPVPDEDVCLLEIQRIKNEFQGRIKNVGFSGHHQGIAIDVATYLLGVHWIERHFTLDRAWKGTDHAASLEPTGLRKLARDIEIVSNALHMKPTEILPIEEGQLKKLKRNNNFDTKQTH